MSYWERIWIASLEIPLWIEQKIQTKHGVDVEEVRKVLVAYIDLLDDDYSAWSLRTVRITSQIPIVRR